jgi:hypothetical protein
MTFARIRVALAALMFASGVFGASIVSTSAQTLPAPAAPAQNELQPTSTMLKANSLSETAGSALTLSVRSDPVSPTASGPVVIYDENGNVLGRTFVSFRGTYQLSISGSSANSLSVGAHTLTAVYLGNATFAASASAPITEVIYPHW